MMSEHSEEKSHEQNIQVTLETILGAPSKLRKIRKTNENRERTDFIKVINLLSAINTRDNILDMEFDMNLSKYNRMYMDVIDILLQMKYTDSQISLINWFLYEKYSDDLISDLIDEKGNVIPTDTPEQLYELFKNYK